MRVWRHTTFIARPREAVFDFLLDFPEAPRWRSFVRTMKQIDDGPARAGTRLHVMLDLMGGEYEFEMTLLELQRPSLWRHKTHETDFDGYVEYRLEPEGDGTRVTLTGEATPVTLYGWLAIPLVLLSRGRAYREQLPRLKHILENER